MNKRSRASYLYAVALVFPLIPVSVQAQTDESERNLIEEVVVTAQRREERLKDVPIAITAITGNQLEKAGVTSSVALTQMTPGLNFAVQGAWAQPIIRGIGSAVTGSGNDANVAIYVDGVYQSNQQANIFELTNIERIEVLKGPQGTLFGRNAAGGAITITTLMPSFDPSARVGLTYGSFNYSKVTAYGTGAITDQLAANLAFLYQHDDGFAEHVDTGDERARRYALMGRLRVLYQPTDAFSVILAGNYSDSSDDSIYVTKPIDGNNTSLRTVPGLYIPADIHESNTDTPPVNDVQQWGGSLTGRYDMGVGTISSITSFQETRSFVQLDSDVTPLLLTSTQIDSPATTFTQEVNYASDFEGPAQVIGGVFYYHDDARRMQISSRGIPGTLTQAYRTNTVTEAAAAYAELTYQVTPSLAVVAGTRYSIERKSIKGGFLLGDELTPGPLILNASEDWGAWTPRLAARFAINDRSNVYATYSKGFKSGIFNGNSISTNSNTPINPEFVKAYEVGYKYAGPRMSFSTSAFHYTYSDLQVSIQRFINNAQASLVQNAAEATSYGGDIEFNVALNRNWRISGGGAYTHGRYDEYEDILITTPIPGGGNTQSLGDATGNPMIRTPEYQANLSVNYSAPLWGGNFDATVNASYNDGFSWDPGDRLKQPPYSLVNATASWETADEQYRFTVWGNNLTDQEYFIYAITSTTGDSGSYQRPRAVGVTIERTF